MSSIEVNKVSFCIPIVSTTVKEAEEDIKSALEQKPDFLEFRRDYLKEIEKEGEILELLKTVRNRGTGIIYTFRSSLEGGKEKADEETRKKSYIRALKAQACDYIDFENSFPLALKEEITGIARDKQSGIIHSTHNFSGVPPQDHLFRLLQDGREGADVVKGAFACNDIKDVDLLLREGRHFREVFPDTPLILIGMGDYGILSRMFPELFCSSLTFAADKKTSAPGQIELETLRKLRKNGYRYYK